ncbi:S41 family peptidase [Chitinophaga nivalis]|uniref:S41 family peptidase n=1 Tax=Chitinophaga nivalis TaxID=2991709 RepID=A0ABT3INI4_9BACT|nr:S41 family peptidase [Chitinophaga nivalis]MCW3464778.1 S41 family peptidase [Chitinophaga nivalis]MCW3485531.1 S41 family peptidase [Chitinophaga nivalis]
MLLGPFRLMAQNKCDCAGSFKWVKETFEKNDAGFRYALEQKGVDAYQQFNKAIQARINKATTREACAAVMREWLQFFRKEHHGIIPVDDAPVATATNTSAWETLPVSEAEVKQQISSAGAASFEGIWSTGAYKLAIIKKGNSYKGVILTSANKNWKPGEVKLKISGDSSGVFYMGDRSPKTFNTVVCYGKNTLQLSNIFLSRVYPVWEDDPSIQLYAKVMTASEPFLQQLSAQTILLRIPTFDDAQKKLIDSVLLANDQLLKRTPNLIIDIRNNGGGSDGSFFGILPLIFTNPIRIVNMEFLSTPLNNKRMEAFLSNPGISDGDKTEIKDALKKLNDHLGEFVNLDSGRIVSEQKPDTIFPFPKNVGIIINKGNGSTAEQFLLAARQSKKVKLFGVTTEGVLDISNTYIVDSPDKQFKLRYCLSKSLRIPDLTIDGKGIMPDYYIDKSIPPTKWLDYVTGILEQ